MALIGNRKPRIVFRSLLGLLMSLGLAGVAFSAWAQPAFKVGDTVEANLSMSSAPESTRWSKATVTRIEMWEGRVSGVLVKTDAGQEHMLGERHLRPAQGENKQVGAVVTMAKPVAPSTQQASSGACQLGARVTDRQNRSGTVVEARGADCRVRLADGTVKYYLAWMLAPEGLDSAPSAALARGTYTCVAAGGTAGTLQLVIKSDSLYANRQGKTGQYQLDPKTKKIVFNSGPWEDFYGGVLGPGKIGLSSRPGGFYNTVCDLK